MHDTSHALPWEAGHKRKIEEKHCSCRTSPPLCKAQLARQIWKYGHVYTRVGKRLSRGGKEKMSCGSRKAGSFENIRTQVGARE